MIAQLFQQPHDTPNIVRFTRTGIAIPRKWQEPIEQRTLRGRIVGIPALTWKHFSYGCTTFAPWPITGGKRYLMVRFATRRHGVLTLPLPPSSVAELLRLETEMGPIEDIALAVSIIDKGGYFFATFAEAKRRRRAS